MSQWNLGVLVLCLAAGLLLPKLVNADGLEASTAVFSHLVGRPTEHSISISVLSAFAVESMIEYGTEPGTYSAKTAAQRLDAGRPFTFEVEKLSPSTRYFYRVLRRSPGAREFEAGAEASFRTARRPVESFVFAVQGDSHPERPGRMFDEALYSRALGNVAADRPDFYFLMGDDFSIERLIERGTKSQDAVDSVYLEQRAHLATVGRSTPLMLVNGNHEQAAKYLLDGTANNFAVFAGKARTTYFPLPAPGDFYSGNSTPVEHVGLLCDYYAWEWGDALFVVIDPYWHSDVPVDNEAGARAPKRDAGRADGALGADRRAKGARDLWQITLGDEQYGWLRTTLTRSKARFKFVFSHHVSGTGRGGVEVAPYYEWGGQDRRGGGGRKGAGPDGDAAADRSPERGLDRFFRARPTWEKPIHDLMRDTGVTIFFQGHDHLYARQELDGVIYQSCPNPADPTFTAFNREAYRTGDIFPNSGHLRVTVAGGADAQCTVEYVRAARPADEAEHGKNGSIVHRYTARPRPARAPAAPASQEHPR